MSSLLIDLGNTRCKAAWRVDGGIELIGGDTDLARLLGAVEQAPDRVWLSSVAGESATRAVQAWCAEHWGCPLIEVTVERFLEHLPTQYAVDQLGVDRWLALLACTRAGHAPAVVVDCGTAITIDVLSAQGEHAGGYILPGFELMRGALLEATAIRVQGNSEAGGLPRNTASAIAQAGPAAVAALVDSLAEASEGMVILGGGGSGELAGCLQAPSTCLQQLVLRGLAALSFLEED